MDITKALTTVIYDSAGTVYYLIFQNKKSQWVLPKTLENNEQDPVVLAQNLAKQVTSLHSLQVTHKIEPAVPVESEGKHYHFEIFLVEASMNSPILISNEHFDTYLWGTYDRCVEKITSQEERFILQKSHELLISKQNSSSEE